MSSGWTLNCKFIELLITFAVNIVKKHHCYPLQGVPSVMSLSIAAVTGCPGGCRLHVH